MEKNFAKYEQYKGYFEANQQEYPKFIEKDAEYNVNRQNFDEKHKF